MILPNPNHKKLIKKHCVLTSATSVALFTSTNRTPPSLHITATVVESGRNLSCVAPLTDWECGR